jgi:hypothetical protein
MYDIHCLVMLKAENPAAYKKLAEEGMMLAHTVSIKGNSVRPDVGMPYHATVKVFDTAKDHQTGVHDVARKLKFTPPNPHETGIEPAMFKDRFGNDVYVVKLHGQHADQMKENNSKFSHMGFPTSYEFTPHVSVDKNTWDGIVDSGAKTAHEAGMEFGHAQLKQGHDTVTSYKHGTVSHLPQQHKKLAASEVMVGEPLNKSLKSIATAATMAATLGLAVPTQTANPAVQHSQVEQQNSGYNSKKMLRTIATVESSGGKFMHHRQITGGVNAGETAYGKYGLTPVTIRETVRMNKDLKSKYGKVASLEGNDFKHFMQDNPGLEDNVAEKHLSRLEHHFGKDPAKIGYAWLEGIKGTYKADKEKKDIGSHWHVKKIKDAYKDQK